jgi:AraC-like DNA-binding protein
MQENDQKAQYPNRKTVKRGELTVTARVVGRDKTLVPEDEVEHLAEIGSTDREIAQYYGVSESSFRYNFSDILTKGRCKLKQKLRQKMIQQALGGDRVLLIFLSKNYLGMSDNPIDTDDSTVLPWNEQVEEETQHEEQNSS